jgi:DNA (cytosine-5)-methyltransferase 1
MSVVSNQTSTIVSVTNAHHAPDTNQAEADTSDGPTLDVAEFFAGIGLARMGLEQVEGPAKFRVTWANDIEADKQAMYEQHFGVSGEHHRYVLGDIAKVQASDLPRGLAVAWASFPCTDLSLAGGRQGLKGKHSGTFWNLVSILKEMDSERPPLVALENVNGFATSHKGEDLREAVRTLNELDYSVDVMTIDARRFVPQSRPRLFLVAVERKTVEAIRGGGAAITLEPSEKSNGGPSPSILRPQKLIEVLREDPSLVTHQMLLPDPPDLLESGFTELAERLADNDPQWWDTERTAKFLKEVSDIQKQRLAKIQEGAEKPIFRTAYRRTRNGRPAWEIRADDIAGCLRTTGGGSSKQAVVRIQRGAEPRVRWMTPLEYAKLMGADDYRLSDARRNQALFGFGDAVCVQVVEWLGHKYLHPVATIATAQRTA